MERPMRIVDGMYVQRGTRVTDVHKVRKESAGYSE